MRPILTALFLVFLGMIILLIIIFKKQEPAKSKIIITNVLTFIVCYIVYELIICIILMLILGIIFSKLEGFDASMALLYSVGTSVLLSPVLSLITTIRLHKKRFDGKTKKIWLIIVLSILAIIGILIFMISNRNLNNTLVKQIYYNITYYDDYTPGAKYEILVHEDHIEITKTSFCSALDCESHTEKEVHNYSKENIQKLRKYIMDNFSEEYFITLHNYELTDNQKDVMQGLILGEKFLELNIEEYKYKIEYSKNDHLSYDIYFKEDGSILVKKSKINSNYDIVSVDTYPLNFSKKNLKILNDYIEKEVRKENKNIIYKYATLKKDEINIYKSIIENNESYLKNIENEAELLYKISYSGIKCLTPELYLYSDNTYEYYYTFSTSDKKIVPKTGTYDYDINNIIDSVSNYPANEFEIYLLEEENGKTYTTSFENPELKKLLTSLNISLDKCLEQQK